MSLALMIENHMPPNWPVLLKFLEHGTVRLPNNPPAVRSLARSIVHDPFLLSFTGYYTCDHCGATYTPTQEAITQHKSECGDHTSIYTTSGNEVIIAIGVSVYGREDMEQFEAENFLVHVQRNLPDIYWHAFQIFRSSAVLLGEEPYKLRVLQLERLFWEALAIECRKFIATSHGAGKEAHRKVIVRELLRRFNGFGVDNARHVFNLMQARDAQARDIASIGVDTIASLMENIRAVPTIPNEAVQNLLIGLVNGLSASGALANGWVISMVRVGQNEEQGVTLILCDEGDRMTIRASVWGKNNDEVIANAVRFSNEKTPREYYQEMYGFPYEPLEAESDV